ncbi:MAG: hypothetical protein QXE90_02010 [Candidatus Micrarchaeia archaeon]
MLESIVKRIQKTYSLFRYVELTPTKEVENAEQSYLLSEIKNASIRSALENYLIALILGSIVFFILNYLFDSSSIMVYGITSILTIIIYLALFAILSELYTILAKLFGGKSDFTSIFYIASLTIAPISSIGIGLSPLPIVGRIVTLAVSLINIGYWGRVINITTGLEGWKAILVWLIGQIIVFAPLFIFGIIKL